MRADRLGPPDLKVLISLRGRSGWDLARSRRFPSEMQAEHSLSVSSLRDGGACVHEKYISQQKERFSNEAGLLAAAAAAACRTYSPAGRPCLHTAQCLTAAGDGGVGVEAGGGAGQHYTWIYSNLLTSRLVLLGNMCVWGFFKAPRGALIGISVHFLPVQRELGATCA